MNEVNLEILHFDEHIFRKDYKTIHWARFDVDLLSHPDFFNLTAAEFIVYIHFICISAKMRNPKIRMNIPHTAHCLRIKQQDILSCISKLNGKRWKSLDENESVQIPSDSVGKRANITEHNEHNRTQRTESYCSTPPQAAARRQTKQTFPFSEFIPKVGISDNWIKLYSKDYLDREQLKLTTWLAANPGKNKRSEKGWVQFLSNWYERGWQGHLKQGKNENSKHEGKFDFLKEIKNESTVL